MTTALGYDDRDALYGGLREHHLRIGDTQFYVPPTAIQVTRRMKNNKVNVLRGRGSFIKNSGYFDQIIDITLFFPDMNSINNELRPLLSQVRKCPFLPIENTLLNDIYKIEAVTVAGITVQTTPGFPHTLQAQLQLYKFNPFTYIVDETERTFDEMFNWPLFRWHYQRNLKPNPLRNIIYYEPLQMELHNNFMFRIASEDDLAFMKRWKKTRDKLIKQYTSDMHDKALLDPEDYNWIGPIPLPKGDVVKEDENGNIEWSGSTDDELDEMMFNYIIDEMYKDNPGKVLNEYDIHMENWDIPGLTLEELSAGYENMITSVQLQAHESPTHQYLGSQDVIFVARFKAEDEEALGSFESMLRRTAYLTREYHKEISNGFLEFDHQLVRLFGVKYVVVEDVVTQTVDGQPGVYNITLTLSSYNRAQKRIAETQWLTQKAKWDIGTGEKAWWNIFDKPWLREDPLGGFMSLDVKKKALYDAKVKEMFKSMEVYPDLELPTYKEVADAGFQIKNLNGGEYVDPDFFLIYEDPIDYSEQISQYLNETLKSESRDYMGGKAEVTAGIMTPDENTQKAIDEERKRKAASKTPTPPPAPQQISAANLTPENMEVLIRKKADEAKISQTLALALAKTFDPKMRHYYEVGPGANKDLGGMVVTNTNVPIMQTKDMRYFKDPDFIRDAGYIGVLRVSPLMGDPRGLGYNIEYNVEQGIAGLKYYLDLVKSGNQVNENVYTAFGLSSSGYEGDIERAQWVGAISMYLGFEREYQLLLNNNKKLPAQLTALIKKVLLESESLVTWSETQLHKKYSALPVPDYKTVSMNSAEPNFQEKILHEEDFADTETIYREMFHDMAKYDRRGRLVRAFPTFFLVFVDEGQFLGAVKMSDQYFGYRAVTDITYTNSRKNASSTLVLEMCNVFGSLTDAIKANDLTHTSIGDLIQTLFLPGEMAQEIERSRHRNENWYKSIYLRTGARVHFRMGYGSNPMNMPTVVNGVVTALQNNGETVTVVVQDDGIELTNKLKASPDDTTRGFLFSTKEPTEIIDELLTDNQGTLKNLWANYFSNASYAKHSLGIMHFGAPGKPINYFWRSELADRPKNEITMNIYETTGRLKEEADGFWYKVGDYFGIGDSDERGININLYDKSVWDILSICASVGEDYIVAVHPFDFRNTIFLGKPYFPIGYEYVITNEYLASDNILDRTATKPGNALPNPLDIPITGSAIDNEEDFTGIAIRYKPFRQIHIFDSWTSIIDNGIYATDENMYTVAIGVYYDEGRMDTTEPIYVDTNIWPEKQRTIQIDTQLNLQGVRLIENIPLIGHWLNKPFKWMFDEYTAIRIAAAGLRDLVKEMYDGYLTVMGDPSVKPYNQVYLYDTFLDMSGPCEVREVVQIMNFETGFITMIKPDACVVNSDRKIVNFWTSCAALAGRMYLVHALRMMLRNSEYKGAYPIMNAVWASVKRRWHKLTGKWDQSKMAQRGSEILQNISDRFNNGQQRNGATGPIYEVDPITGEVREYAPVSTETKRRWKKSELLKEFVKNIDSFTLKDAELLFDYIDDALANRRILGYHKIDIDKIVKLKGTMSNLMFKSAKTLSKLGKAARWGKSGVQAALGAAAAFTGPIGWLAYAVEFLVVETICAGISEFIERSLFMRKACIIATLRKDGVEYSAGINGHMGSVIGDSPDMWQKMLTTGIGGFLLGFLGADVSKYQGVTPDEAEELYGPSVPGMMSEGDQQTTTTGFDLDRIARNFYNSFRKPVNTNPKLIEIYKNEVTIAEKEKEGHMKAKEEEQSRQATYPAETRQELTKDLLQGILSDGQGGYIDEGSFETMDLNKPSGISAEAIDRAFAGTGLAGTGAYFKQIETQIPSPPSPLANGGTSGARVMNGLYLAAHAAWETGWGTSRIFRDKNNLFGYGAYDHDPYNSAYTFASVKDCIFYAANKIKDNYLTPGGKFYNGPTLKGMNVKYASDPNWHKGIAQIMAKIAKYDPNFIPPGATTGKASSSAEKPTVFGSEGKARYHLASSTEAARVCVNLNSMPKTNFKVTLVTPSAYIRRASYDYLEALGKAYKERTGETLVVTSAYREGDPDWHGTGFGVDVDTPNAGYIGGRCRFPRGSREKQNLKILMELAISVGFDGIIHGDVDVVEELKSKYPNKRIMQRDDHFNHLHLSYPT
jgi:beta-N-acetylglucosaminidase